MERIAGRTALVTGAASGIGLAITRSLIAAGAKVAMLDWRSAELETQASQFGDDAAWHVLDVTDREGWASTRSWVESKLGPVEILVNNAGIGPTIGALAESAPESFDRMVSIKLMGTYNGVRTFAGEMCRLGEGHIVNTASIAGLMANAKLGAYTAAKFGVVGLSEVLRLELAESGVGVSVLCPGLVRTNLAANDAAHELENPDTRGSRDISMSGGIDPAIVGDSVVAAIRVNQEYIITHRELRPLVQDRVERILSAFDVDATEALF